MVVLFAMAALACGTHGAQEGGVTVDPAKMFTDASLLAAARAIESNDLPRLDSLVRSGTPVNGRGNEGATLLMFGVGTKRKEAARELVKLGADPNLRAVNGLSAVMLAAGSDDSNLLPILLDGGANPNLHNDRDEPMTFTAAREKRWRNLDLLLDRGANIDATDSAGDTLMISLAFVDRYEPIVKLLERGADFRIAGDGGWTLAHSIQKSRLRPDSADGKWLQKARAFLEAKGVEFPIRTPAGGVR